MLNFNFNIDIYKFYQSLKKPVIDNCKSYEKNMKTVHLTLNGNNHSSSCFDLYCYLKNLHNSLIFLESIKSHENKYISFQNEPIENAVKIVLHGEHGTVFFKDIYLYLRNEYGKRYA